MVQAEVTLPAAVSSVPTARHFVESILASWGLSALGWTATLVVSELAANAALHAHGDDFSIRVRQDESGVRLEVTDGSLRLPQQRRYSDSATTGRGLRLVADLCQDWGVTATAAGKTVWAVLRMPDEILVADDDADVDALLSAFDDGVVAVLDRADGPQAWARRSLAAAA